MLIMISIMANIDFHWSTMIDSGRPSACTGKETLATTRYVFDSIADITRYEWVVLNILEYPPYVFVDPFLR